jgi:hypothetical protein
MGYYWNLIALKFNQPLNSNNDSYKIPSVLRMIGNLVIFGLILAMFFKSQYYYQEANYYYSGNNLNFYGSFENNFSKNDFESIITDEELKIYNRYWEPYEYIDIFDMDNFDIYTNFAIQNLSIGFCAEDPNYADECDPNNNDKCKKDHRSQNGNQTGKCVETYNYVGERSNDTKLFLCEIKSWCPVAFFPHLRKEKEAILVKSGETVMFLQNFIGFPEFNVKFETVTEDPELNCLFDPVSNKSCPFFKIKDIVELVENNDADFDSIAKYTGDTIEIKFEWNCVLGYKCEPVISFWKVEDENSDPYLMWSLWKYDKKDFFQRTALFGSKIRFHITTTGSLKRIDWITIWGLCITYLFIVSIYDCIFMLILSCFSMRTPQEDFVYCFPIFKLKKLIFSRRKSVDFAKKVKDDTVEII